MHNYYSVIMFLMLYKKFMLHYNYFQKHNTTNAFTIKK